MAAVITRADEPGAVPRTVFFGLLNDVASDPQVTDLAVTCDGRVWADRGNGMRETVLRVPFRSPQVVREYAVQLCAQLGRRLDDACPIADAASPDGIRVHAVAVRTGSDAVVKRLRGDIPARCIRHRHRQGQRF